MSGRRGGDGFSQITLPIFDGCWAESIIRIEKDLTTQYPGPPESLVPTTVSPIKSLVFATTEQIRSRRIYLPISGSENWQISKLEDGAQASLGIHL